MGPEEGRVSLHKMIRPTVKQAALSTIHRQTHRLWDILVAGQREYAIQLKRLDCGALVLNTSHGVAGSLEAGRLVTQLSQGGLGTAVLGLMELEGICLPEITVDTRAPAAACLDLQMAIPLGNALLSGPIRLFMEPLRFVEEDIPLSSATGAMTAVVEQEEEITSELALELAEAAHLRPEQLRMVSVSMGSVVGNTQIAGRVVEEIVLTVGRSLELDPTRITGVVGKNPVCPIYPPGQGTLLPDDFTHYTAQAYLGWLGEEGEDLQGLAQALCFRSTYCYGQLFSELLTQAGGNFWDIPDITHINKISRVTVNDLTSGRLVSAGEPEARRLASYFKQA